MVQKCRRILWAKAHLKWTVSNWKSVLWSDESKFDILVGNNGHCVLRAKEEGDLFYLNIPFSVLSAFSSKAIISDGMEVHKCIRYGSLHVLEGTINAERDIKVLNQHMLPSRWRVFSGKTCVFQNHHKIITIKRTKGLNYFRLCALNLFNTQVWIFELNYLNKLTFTRHSNLLRCTFIHY